MLVFWIHASSPTIFRQGYRDIADRLSLPGREDPKVDVLQVVYAWLSDCRNGQWLIILDNVDDDDVLFGYDPASSSKSALQATNIAENGTPLERYLAQTAHGTILVTSRNTDELYRRMGATVWPEAPMVIFRRVPSTASRTTHAVHRTATKAPDARNNIRQAALQSGALSSKGDFCLATVFSRTSREYHGQCG